MMKTAPVGVCDLCDELFPTGVPHYTSKGRPRLHCSRECRNTANSRTGTSIRSKQARARVRRGEWKNPSPFVRDDATEEEIEAIRQKISDGVSELRRQEVREDRWRNPALSDEARRKLSKPRVHGDNPTLHSAIEKLHWGASIADLSPEERQAHRAYRRKLYRERGDEVRAQQRRRYRQIMSTGKGRSQQREKWRRQRERLVQREPNRRLIEARQQAGLSQSALAQILGVSQTAVSKWELFGVVPRSENVRRRAEELLGLVWL